MHQTDSFVELSLADQVRYQRFVRASNRRLRYQLLVQRSLLEASLEDKRLQYLSTHKEFAKLDPELHGLLSYPFVRDRAASLKRAVQTFVRRKAMDRRLLDIEKTLALPGLLQNS